VRYYTPPSSPRIRDLLDGGRVGAISTPPQGNIIRPGWDWIADTGCYGKGYPGDARYLAWLGKMSPIAAWCRFATAPDVVCDARATLARSAPMLPQIRAAGYVPAFVLQNGVTRALVPWDDIGAVFIGGDDEFKTCPVTQDLITEARARGLVTHMGRGNTLGRLMAAARMGCDGADGKTMALFPATIAPMLRWLGDNRVQQQMLW
jgi:hypothetical protein